MERVECCVKKKKRMFIIFALALSIVSLSGCKEQAKQSAKNGKMSYESLQKDFDVEKNAEINVWYSKNADEQFLLEASEAFEEKYSIKITYTQVKKSNYLKEIATKTRNGKGPDLYLISNDQLKQAKELGVAKPIILFNEQFLKENYPKTAILASSLKDGVYGYPLYFNTCFLLYQSEYIKYPPRTFDEMLEYGEQFSDEKDNTTLFKWDLTDPYTNFMFLGTDIRLFGETGDEESIFKINNYQTIEAMQYFQELSNLPVGTMKTADYSSVLESIEQEEALFAICKIDALRHQRKNSPYKIALLPDLTKEMESYGLSTTQLAVVNEGSKQPKASELFASYLSYEFANQQYDTVGLPSSKKGILYENEQLNTIYRQYEKSFPIPKAENAQEFWNDMKIVNNNIWNGATVSKQLNEVQKKMEMFENKE